MALGQRHGRVGQRNAVEAGLAVDMLGRHQIALQRPVAPRIDRQIGPSRQFADDPRILCRQRQRHVARNAGQAKNLDLGRGEGKQDRDRVVLAGIGVDDDFLSSHGASVAATVTFAPRFVERLRAPRRHEWIDHSTTQSCPTFATIPEDG